MGLVKSQKNKDTNAGIEAQHPNSQLVQKKFEYKIYEEIQIIQSFSKYVLIICYELHILLAGKEMEMKAIAPGFGQPIGLWG